MPNVLRTAWKANRVWLAAGFLISTSLFLLYIFVMVRSSFMGISESKATGLGAIAGSPASFFFPELREWALREQRAPVFLEARYTGEEEASESETKTPAPEHLVIRSATLNIVATDPATAAVQVRALAADMSGFVVNSSVKGDQAYRAAQVVMRIPALRFDEARARVRQLASWVDEDSVQARDVTREAIDQDAALRNARAEEGQYLAILKRAATVKDVIEVSEKLANVRTRIDRQTAELRYLEHQVEMSLLTVSIAAVPPSDKPGVNWRPGVSAKMSGMHALAALGDFADAVVSLLLHLPVVAAWVLLLFVILKAGWWVLTRLARVFFPDTPWWKRHEQQVQER